LTPLLPASIMHTAALSPEVLVADGRLSLDRRTDVAAATLAMDSVGNPVLGIPIGTAVCQGTGTCAAIPAA